jgi:hypothetical protein
VPCFYHLVFKVDPWLTPVIKCKRLFALIMVDLVESKINQSPIKVTPPITEYDQVTRKGIPNGNACACLMRKNWPSPMDYGLSPAKKT